MLAPGLEKMLTTPAALTTLDLSCNRFEVLPPELKGLKRLRVLYLHSNSIGFTVSRLLKQSLGALEGMTQLTQLTLHGNPVSEATGYRIFVLWRCPTLTCLDFKVFTADERRLATGQWRRSTPRTP